jgi:copper chaperone CopZ
MKTETQNTNKWAGAGIMTAIVASLCCITPVLALVAGTSGIASSFSWLEPFRIYLIGITALVLGFAWYLKLRPRKSEEIQCACEADEKPSFWQSKSFLGLVTVAAVVMLAFPYYSGIFYPDDKKEVIIVKQDAIQTLHLDVKGMTCSACDSHVVHAAMGVEGVIEATADHKEGKAVVKFDNSKTSENKIIKSIDATGYEVTGKDLTSTF